MCAFLPKGQSEFGPKLQEDDFRCPGKTLILAYCTSSVVIEATGYSDIAAEVVEFVRPEGKIHYLGYYPHPMILTEWNRWFSKNLTITMCVGGYAREQKTIFKLIEQGRFDAKSIVESEATVTYDIKDAGGAYRDLKENKDKMLKVLFKWED